MIKKFLFNLAQTKTVEKLYRRYWLFLLKRKKDRFINTGNKPRLFWGPDPLISNKYWSKAMKEAGYHSHTVMKSYYSINKKEDYDIYFGDIPQNFKSVLLPNFIAKLYYKLVVFEHLLFNYDIFHIPFTGLLFGGSDMKNFENPILKLLGKKTIVMPYGGDAYMYSKIKHTPVHHVFLLSYPEGVKREATVEHNVKFWEQNADFMVVAFFVDGVSRWDALPFNPLIIDVAQWSQKKNYNSNDGINGPVTIVHTPNHRGFKGTEFVIEAVNQLKAEGLKINFLLIENVQNDEVRRIFNEEADILAEQFVYAYGISAAEGMVTGLPVLANLSVEEYTRVFRRYSYLNECPILTTTPENIKENLKIMIRNPELRKQLGEAGRKYVEKYHSNATAQYIYPKIYEKIWYNKEVDLMNMFHPLNIDSYNNKSPKIEHPLYENTIPPALMANLKK